MRRLNTGEWIAIALAVLVVLVMFLLSFVLSPFSSPTQVEVIEEQAVAEATTTPADDVDDLGSISDSVVEVQ